MPDRYRKGAHTIYDIKYQFVWKTKCGYGVLKDIGVSIYGQEGIFVHHWVP